MTWKQKLGSRKLWACVAGVVMGAAMIFGLDEEVIGTVAGAVTSLVSLVVYIVTEGKVDAQAVATTIVTVQDAVDTVEDAEDVLLDFDILDDE